MKNRATHQPAKVPEQHVWSRITALPVQILSSLSNWNQRECRPVAQLLKLPGLRLVPKPPAPDPSRPVSTLHQPKLPHFCLIRFLRRETLEYFMIERVNQEPAAETEVMWIRFEHTSGFCMNVVKTFLFLYFFFFLHNFLPVCVFGIVCPNQSSPMMNV